MRDWFSKLTCFLFVLLTGGVLFPSVATQAQNAGGASLPAPVAPPLGANSSNSFALEWLKDPSALQQNLIEDLQRLAGQKISAPVMPNEPLVRWYRLRHAGTHKPFSAKDSRSLVLLGEELGVAQQFLVSPQIEQRREGLLLIFLIWSPLAVSETAKPPLATRVIEAFLLPYLNDGYREDWKLLSRVQILQNASAAYERTKSVDKNIAVLRLLIEVAQQDNSQTKDWARFKLAPLLAQRKQLGEAIELLKAISSPSLQAVSAPLIQNWQEQVGKNLPKAKQ